MKKGYLLVILLCALMAGCSSTYSSRKLAENTAANAVLFASEIQKSEESQLRLLKAREKNIKQFSNKLIRAQQQIEFLRLQVDDGVQNKVEKELHRWLKKLKEMQIAMHQKEDNTPVFHWQDKRTQTIKQLSEFSRQMLILSQDEKLLDKAKFMMGYFNAVKEQTKINLSEKPHLMGFRLDNKLQQLLTMDNNILGVNYE